MSQHAFYLPSAFWGDVIVLDGQEAAHARVLRLKPGDRVTILDGKGKSALCRVTEMRKKDVRLEMLAENFVPQPKAGAIIALALSKAVRRGFFMEKAVELGAREIWLWQARRSQGKLSREAGGYCEGRLIAGMKQCLNPWLPQTRMLDNIEAVAEHSLQADWRILPWESQSGIPMLELTGLGRAGVSVYVIGPEGGFDEHELDVLGKAGFMAVSMGKRVLRCETAATLCLGLHWWASQLPGRADFQEPECQTK